jgi:hypothetical protein
MTDPLLIDVARGPVGVPALCGELTYGTVPCSTSTWRT